MNLNVFVVISQRFIGVSKSLVSLTKTMIALSTSDEAFPICRPHV